MNMADMCIEAFKTLGDKAEFSKVSKWVRTKFDAYVSDTTFYKARKLYRDKMRCSVEPSRLPILPVAPAPERPASNVSTASFHDILLSDLKRVLAFAKEFGGVERLASAVNTLVELKNVR